MGPPTSQYRPTSGNMVSSASARILSAFLALTLPAPVAGDVFNASEGHIVVTDNAMGARCAVVADFDGDGRMDVVAASSNDNAVSWFRNEGLNEEGHVTFSIKQEISWKSMGSQTVAVADIDGDGDVDVVGASYDDDSLRWYENDGTGVFTSHVISSAINEGQGVTVADLDNDGNADIISASSGDNTIAVFKNMYNGIFCEIKEVIDDNAIGARSVVASDLDGDGWIDLASASKDDDTIAWYPNDGTGHFPTKIVISKGKESLGAYSLVAVDIDKDGDNDLIVASNGNDHVSLWRNNGRGNFTKTLIFDKADFVLSVTAVDFDHDGDMDVASASFYDGYINWYENVDGRGYEWKNHTIYVGLQGHYVSYGDMDGDGDDDLIAAMHAENTVHVFLAHTECDLDGNNNHQKEACCHMGTEWNGTACEHCPYGTYGMGNGLSAQCRVCPVACVIPGHAFIPETCSGITGCDNVEDSIAACSCPEHTMKDPMTDTCEVCPEGQIRPDSEAQRTTDTIGNYTLWEMEQGTCYVEQNIETTALIAVGAFLAFLVLVITGLLVWRYHSQAKADALWKINEKSLQYDYPVHVLGKGQFGEVQRGYLKSTIVAVKRTRAIEDLEDESGTGGEDASKRALEEVTSSQMLAGDANASRLALTTKEKPKSFIQEMRILSKLQHPRITKVLGAAGSVSVGENPLLVMEYAENGSLRDLLSNKTFPLDPELELPLIRDIIQGVRYLHSQDPPVIHGDLKCANILVDRKFRAKITDFGLSIRPRAVGTPFFMAPELLKGGHISKQSDIYAFGVSLWEVMTHKVPYEGLNMDPKVVLGMICEGKLRPNCNQGLDEELVECMNECWAQDPKKRPKLEDLEMKLIPLCGQNLFSLMQAQKRLTKSKDCLEKFFPEYVVNNLLVGKKVAQETHVCVSICFIEIAGITDISTMLTTAELSDFIDRLYMAIGELAIKHRVLRMETTGNGWMGVTNLTQAQNDHVARMSHFSIDAVKTAQSMAIHTERPEVGNARIRVGFHSGPVVSHVVGKKNPRYCLLGDSMNFASGMESTSRELRIQCSEVSARLAKEQDNTLRFSYRGNVRVKGKGAMKSFWLDETSGGKFAPATVARLRVVEEGSVSSNHSRRSFASDNTPLPPMEAAPEMPLAKRESEKAPSEQAPLEARPTRDPPAAPQLQPFSMAPLRKPVMETHARQSFEAPKEVWEDEEKGIIPQSRASTSSTPLEHPPAVSVASDDDSDEFYEAAMEVVESFEDEEANSLNGSTEVKVVDAFEDEESKIPNGSMASINEEATMLDGGAGAGHNSFHRITDEETRAMSKVANILNGSQNSFYRLHEEVYDPKQARKRRSCLDRLNEVEKPANSAMEVVESFEDEEANIPNGSQSSFYRLHEEVYDPKQARKRRSCLDRVNVMKEPVNPKTKSSF